jgi:hypothetical protein
MKFIKYTVTIFTTSTLLNASPNVTYTDVNCSLTNTGVAIQAKVSFSDCYLGNRIPYLLANTGGGVQSNSQAGAQSINLGTFSNTTGTDTGIIKDSCNTTIKTLPSGVTSNTSSAEDGATYCAYYKTNSYLLTIQAVLNDKGAGNYEWTSLQYNVKDISNTLPIVSNIAISGTAEIGQTLSGSYDYSDTDSDEENGTTFKWYRADDTNGTNASAITDANSTTYTITTDDGGKYLTFGVTPKDGIDFGSEVNSSYTTLIHPKVDFNSSIITANSWNMVSVPDERNVSVSNLSGATIWTFNNSTNQWEQPSTLTAGKGYLLYTSSSIGLVSADKVSSTITSDYTTIQNIENNNTWTLVGISKSTTGISWKDIYNPTNTLKSGCSYTQIFYYDSVNSTWNTSTNIPYQAGIWVKQNCFNTIN